MNFCEINTLCLDLLLKKSKAKINTLVKIINMLLKEYVLEKFSNILKADEEIEYVSIEKKLPKSFIVLTNERIIYSNKKLLENNVFHIFTIKNNNVTVLTRIKKVLQSEKEIEKLIEKYFSQS